MTKIIKLSFCDELRRVPIGVEGKPEDYDDLLNAIRVTFPATDGATLTVTWKDEDGDTITMSSHAEFTEAMKCMSKGVPKFLVTAKTNPPTPVNPASQAPSSNPAPKNNTVHDDVECDGCGMHPIIGVRYKSTFRENYDICEKCESTLKPTEPMAKLTTKADASKPSFAPAALLNNTLGQVASTLDSLLQNTEASQAWQRCSTTTAPFVSAVDQMCSRWSGVRSPQPPQPCTTKPALKFLRDECLSDGTQVTPGASFLKGWLVCNDGKTAWPEGCGLYTAGGDALLAVDYVPAGTAGTAGAADSTNSCGAATPSENKEVLAGEPISPPLTVGEERVLYVLLTAPMKPGRYVAYFRMKTAEGRRFGHRLWADIVVTAPCVGVVTPASPAQGLCDDSSVSSVSDTLSPVSESFNYLDTVNNVSTTTSTAKPKQQRVRSPYILFCNEQRPKLRVSHPNASFGETGKLLGEMWYALDDQAKAAYGWAPGCAAATNTTTNTNTTATPTTTTEQAPLNTPPPSTSLSAEVEFSAAPPLYWHQELAILAEMGFEDIDNLIPLLKKFVKHPAGVAGGAEGVSGVSGDVGGVSGVSGESGVSGGVGGSGGIGEVSGEGTHSVSASSVEEKQRVAAGLQQVLSCLLGTRVTEVYI